MPLSPQSRCSAGRRPATGTMSHIETDGGSEEQTARRLPCGFLWPRGDRGAPRYSLSLRAVARGVASGAGDAHSRWPCGRIATLAYAARRNRARGHCRTTDTPQPPHWTARVKASLGTLAAPAAAPTVSHSEARIAHYNLATPRPPRPRDADPGRGRPCLARAARPDALSGRVACGWRESDGGTALLDIRRITAAVVAASQPRGRKR